MVQITLKSSSFANEWVHPCPLSAKCSKKNTRDLGWETCGPSGSQNIKIKVYLRHSCSNGTLWISGSCCFNSWWLKWWLVNKWKQTPEATRPARPFLCRALAWETKVSSRLSIPLLASYLQRKRKWKKELFYKNILLSMDRTDAPPYFHRKTQVLCVLGCFSPGGSIQHGFQWH